MRKLLSGFLASIFVITMLGVTSAEQSVNAVVYEKCRAGEIITYTIQDTNGKVLGTVMAKGFYHVPEALKVFEEDNHLNLFWSYRDINANGSFERECPNILS